MALYDNAYSRDNVYGHVRVLLEEAGVARQAVHLDLGCGFGRIAEALRDELGLIYVGLDADAESLASLAERGFEACAVDLSDVAALTKALEQALQGRTLGSISMVDVLEHLADPAAVLRAVREVALKASCPLVTSVPNVAHRDVGFKLALGRWDITPTGILDITHLQYFTERSLEDLMARVGFHEIGRRDVHLEKSDQHFPPLHPVLAEATPLHDLLYTLRRNVDRTANINQLVRSFLSGPVRTLSRSEHTEDAAPFLSVVTRTQGRRLGGLRETLLCLSSQTDPSFEVIVVGHQLSVAEQISIERLIEDLHPQMRAKVRLVRVDDGNRTKPLNVGFENARGAYVAILDDDDLVFGNWVETFHALSTRASGAVLRAGTVSQTWEPVRPSGGDTTALKAVSGFQRYSKDFECLQQLRQNLSPNVALAFPRTAFTELGIRFDEELTTTEDWDFLMRVVSVCGIANSRAVTAVYRFWRKTESSATVHSTEEWQANLERVWRKLDDMPMVFPRGTAARIREAVCRIEELEKEVARQKEQLQHERQIREVSLANARSAEAERDRVRQASLSLSHGSEKPYRYQLADRLNVALKRLPLVQSMLKGSAQAWLERRGSDELS